MGRPLSIVSAVALVVFLGSAAVLGRLEQTGPDHTDLWLEGSVPATLFLPGEPRGRVAFSDAPPEAERPPAVVLMHGFSGDRRAMSGFARRLASGGVAVLTIDASGHGRNRNPYRHGDARGDTFAADLGAAVDFLRMSPRVDGLRIAVAGHSMGASAALDYATRDASIAAAVMVSGGVHLDGPFLPGNALFLYAEREPARVRERSNGLAARIAGLPAMDAGESAGSLERGDAVRVVEIPGTDHQSIVWSDAAVDETLAWLRGAFGEPAPAGPAPGDPRVAWLGLLVVALLALLPGLGHLAGSLAPERSEPAVGDVPLDLAWVAAALLLPLPLLAHAPRILPIPLVAADTLATLLLLGGVVLIVALRLRRPGLLEAAVARPVASLAAAGVAVMALVALLLPTEPVVHDLGVTPDRALGWLLLTLALLPLAVGQNTLLRRGPTVRASLAMAGARLVLLAVLGVGIGLGALPPVLGLFLPTLIGLFLVLELVAGFVYARSRNVLAIAGVEAGWLALVLAAILPVRA